MKSEKPIVRQSEKKSYAPPRLKDYGPINEVTGWIGGRFGEFFGGEGTGWNPYKDPPSGS